MDEAVENQAKHWQNSRSVLCLEGKTNRTEWEDKISGYNSGRETYLQTVPRGNETNSLAPNAKSAITNVQKQQAEPG